MGERGEKRSSDARPPEMRAGEELEASGGPDAVGVPSRGRRGSGERRPLTVNVEFVVVDGEEAAILGRRQAAVVREVLQWFYDNPEPGQTQQSADEPGSDS